MKYINVEELRNKEQENEVSWIWNDETKQCFEYVMSQLDIIKLRNIETGELFYISEDAAFRQGYKIIDNQEALAALPIATRLLKSEVRSEKFSGENLLKLISKALIFDAFPSTNKSVWVDVGTFVTIFSVAYDVS